MVKVNNQSKRVIVKEIIFFLLFGLVIAGLVVSF